MLNILYLILQLWVMPINTDALVYSIHQMESSGAYEAPARYEPLIYEKYRDKGEMPYLIKYYGREAACSSYGIFQVTLLTAREAGFDVSPWELAERETNELIAKELLLRYTDRYGYHFGALPKIYKRWNGGSAYGAKAWRHYWSYVCGSPL